MSLAIAAGSICGQGGFVGLLTFRGVRGGGVRAVVQNKESPDFRGWHL